MSQSMSDPTYRLTVVPGQILGWRQARRYEQPGMYPIYAIGGASPDGSSQNPGDGGQQHSDAGDGKADDSGKPNGGGAQGDDSGKGDAEKNADNNSGKPGDGTDYRAKFEAQQQVNRNLEQSINQLKDGMKSALGIDDKKIDVSDLVSNLQSQLTQLQHDNTVNDVARRHGITDTDDIALLSTAKDNDAMTKLAERLKPSGDSKNSDSNSGKPRTPKPDKSQGNRGAGGDRLKSLGGSELYDRLHPKKNPA